MRVLIALVPLAMALINVVFLLDDPTRWWNLAAALVCAAGFGWCVALGVV